ncbi:helix-turn-helix domain-containing protein [Streptomyces sp. NPDC058653]|uniref:helix-turn-helix domain-containing protein n=1 Tax=Streptomyces sp. NPDC058653 TaxID=3346576 RepID=UPI003665F347
MPRNPSLPRSPTARSHLGQVLDQLIRLASLAGTDTASALGLSAQHLSSLVTGEEFPSRLLTERLARVCGADPLILLKVWEDERSRRDRPM